MTLGRPKIGRRMKKYIKDMNFLLTEYPQFISGRNGNIFFKKAKNYDKQNYSVCQRRIRSSSSSRRRSITY